MTCGSGLGLWRSWSPRSRAGHSCVGAGDRWGPVLIWTSWALMIGGSRGSPDEPKWPYWLALTAPPLNPRRPAAGSPRSEKIPSQPRYRCRGRPDRHQSRASEPRPARRAGDGCRRCGVRPGRPRAGKRSGAADPDQRSLPGTPVLVGSCSAMPAIRRPHSTSRHARRYWASPPRTGRSCSSIPVLAGSAVAPSGRRQHRPHLVSPTGRSAAVSAADNSVSVWDLRSRERVGNPFGPYPGLIPVTMFEPDGRLLIVLLESAVHSPTDVQTWERFACQAAGRDLTRAEWHDLLPTRPYISVCP